MALDKLTLVSDLTTSFAQPTWATSASLFSKAIDSYIKSADATINVTGALINPPFTPVTGVGKGNPLTVGVGALTTAMNSAFALPAWAGIAAIAAPAIETLMITSLLTTDVVKPPVPPYTVQGTGTLGSWVATGVGVLQTALGVAFTTGISWATVATSIADAVDIYLKTVTFTTDPDVGTVPGAWSGTGVAGTLL